MKNRIRVLLVDDEDRFCETTSKLLIKKGFDTTIANNAEMAIQVLKENPQHVIVLDINMTGMNGLIALTKIKKTAPEIQVIMLTGHGSKCSAMRALAREAFDYLSKPCDVDTLASRIHDAYAAKHYEFKMDEKRALNIMIRLNDLMTVSVDMTLKDAMEKMIGVNEKASAWLWAMDKSPSLLPVFDKRSILVGILTRMDIIRAVRPEYVSVGEPFNEESSKFSTIFWSGLFSDRVKEIAEKKVWEIMSERPPVISEYANLLEVAHLMEREPKGLLLVQDISRVIGIIRDQDIFFEIADVMKNKFKAVIFCLVFAQNIFKKFPTDIKQDNSGKHFEILWIRQILDAYPGSDKNPGQGADNDSSGQRP
ncbi:MAG: response regulator [Desulfobacula sp.]|nr:response regulator [Desulfobacterales bacterium]MCK5695095.1 response regulator [Desulfobacula sp.]